MHALLQLTVTLLSRPCLRRPHQRRPVGPGQARAEHPAAPRRRHRQGDGRRPLGLHPHLPQRCARSSRPSRQCHWLTRPLPRTTPPSHSVWADHADTISIPYSGTGALKTDFTRLGTRTRLGMLNDGKNSVMRYIKNNFFDGAKQVRRSPTTSRGQAASSLELTRHTLASPSAGRVRPLDRPMERCWAGPEGAPVADPAGRAVLHPARGAPLPPSAGLCRGEDHLTPLHLSPHHRSPTSSSSRCSWCSPRSSCLGTRVRPS